MVRLSPEQSRPAVITTFDTYAAVWQFHETYDCARSTLPQLPDDGLRAMRVNILTEEVNEYLVGEINNSRVEIADALADIVYVAYGTGIAYGSNVTKPWLSVSCHPLLNTTESRFEDADFRLINCEEMKRALNGYQEAENEDNLFLIIVCLRHIVALAHKIAYDYRIPLDGVLAEVHASNMSKLGVDGKPVKRDDGKVLKGPNYFRPDIAGVLERFDATGPTGPLVDATRRAA